MKKIHIVIGMMVSVIHGSDQTVSSFVHEREQLLQRISVLENRIQELESLNLSLIGEIDVLSDQLFHCNSQLRQVLQSRNMITQVSVDTQAQELEDIFRGKQNDAADHFADILDELD